MPGSGSDKQYPGGTVIAKDERMHFLFQCAIVEVFDNADDGPADIVQDKGLSNGIAEVFVRGFHFTAGSEKLR
jgi:hypothetical protein